MTGIKFGLTGGIGAGKSACSRFLASRGVEIVDADKLTQEAYLVAHDELQRAFGPSIFDDHGLVIRKALGQKVFGNADALKMLNDIMHPVMTKIAEFKISRASGDVLLDAALLFEAGWDTLVERKIVVVAPMPARIERICHRDNTTPELALRRIQAQLSDDERIARADAVIYNVSDLDSLHRQCLRIFK